MLDKLIIRAVIVILLGFILLAVFYQRPEPEQQKRQAAYLPPENFVGKKQVGETLFKQHCAVCHGVRLEGSTKGPSLVHPYYRPEHHADIAVYLAVYQGVKQHHWQFGDMPAQRQLNGEDAGHLLTYIRWQQRQQGLID